MSVFSTYSLFVVVHPGGAYSITDIVGDKVYTDRADAEAECAKHNAQYKVNYSVTTLDAAMSDMRSDARSEGAREEADSRD